jgi:hypothetical protein
LKLHADVRILGFRLFGAGFYFLEKVNSSYHQRDRLRIWFCRVAITQSLNLLTKQILEGLISLGIRPVDPETPWNKNAGRPLPGKQPVNLKTN